MKKKILITLLTILLINPIIFSQNLKINEFDAYVQKAVKDWEIPGLALVIIKNNQVLFKKGYGLREINTAKKVNTQTLFACASTTKAMTAACMAILVDEGKVKWDDQVIQYLPDFQLFDPFVTRELKIRDLFTHNSGVGNTDFLWGDNYLPSTEILRRMRMVKPSYSFRGDFIYQNIFYLAAGEVIAKVSGMSWADFIKKRVFEPLGMTRTFALLGGLKDSNSVTPHFKIDEKIKKIVTDTVDSVAPAGSVWSCVDDLAKWSICMLDSGKLGSFRLVKAQTWQELLRPQVIISAEQFYPTQQLTKPNWMTYGLGWFQQDYKGRKVNFHTGSIGGLVAIHGQIPEEKISIFILGNLDHAELRHALMFKAFDGFALGGNRDWNTEIFSLYRGLAEKSKESKQKFMATKVNNTQPSQNLANYEGFYEDSLYGFIKISLENGQLRFLHNTKTSANLNHWHYDTFILKYDREWYGEEVIQFEINELGKINAIKIGNWRFLKKDHK
jgi:CubicO group peptidase (beta-lactamase class C family)